MKLIPLLFLFLLTSCIQYTTIQDTYLDVSKEVEDEYGIEITRHNISCLNRKDFRAICLKYSLHSRTKGIHLWFSDGRECKVYVKETFFISARYWNIRKLCYHELVHCMYRCHEITKEQEQMFVEFFVETGFGKDHLYYKKK